MNREILFRGKRVDNGDWIEGFYAECDERAFIMPEPDCDTSKHMLDGYWLGVFYEVIPETSGRYTNLTDKNGARIFEGDILSFFNSDGEYTSYEVVWFENRWSVVKCGTNSTDDLDMFFCETSDIIGNIHDNPELLSYKCGYHYGELQIRKCPYSKKGLHVCVYCCKKCKYCKPYGTGWICTYSRLED